MTVTGRKTYTKSGGVQTGKDDSIHEAKGLVSEVHALLAPLLKSCEIYEPDEKSRIKGAPAVALPNLKLAIAPDLKCETRGGNTFWVEVKDKPQRVYFPDTGADVHQVLGWYDIQRATAHPTLLVFRDPPIETMRQGTAPADVWSRFQERIKRYSGKLYGGWLSEALVYRSNHPMICAERSRDMPMHIFYFHVDNLRPIGDLARYPADVDENKVPHLPSELKAFYRDEKKIISEREIRRLSI